MDARKLRWIGLALILGLIGTQVVTGATYRTANFVVHAPTRDFAERVGEAAEYYRERLAVAWLGKRLPKNWSQPCPIDVRVGEIGAGGATSFQFDRGEVFGWRMNIQGSEERILDSVLPHEVSHMIFATYFRRPLPRWADEGAATLIEHESERLRQMHTLRQVMDNGTRYSVRNLLAIKEYPSDMREVLKLYAQGYSLTDYLVQKKGRKTFLEFLDAGMRGGWDAALKKHYGMRGVDTLESMWNNWYMAGSPRLNVPKGEMVADADSADSAVVRAQNPESRAASAEVALGDADESLASADVTLESDESVASVPLFGGANEAETDSATQAVQPPPPTRDVHEVLMEGRQQTLAAGWVPVSAQVAEPVKSKPVRSFGNVAIGIRPPFASEQPERPPFAEEFGAMPKRPPFVDDEG